MQMKIETISLRLEKRRDVEARERLLDAAFGDTRFAKTCERLRETNRAAEGLSLVAVKNGRLVGTLRLWPVVTGDGRSALLLGPLAVDATERSAGIGARLMRLAIKRARRAGHKAILLVGDAPYYARFGFSPELTQGLALPGPVDRARFLGLELAPDALSGASGVLQPAAVMPLSQKPATLRLAA
jgi:predicted N-acetyltransferase YhbS